MVIDEPEIIGKDELLRILRALAYYRPKDELKAIKSMKSKGIVEKPHEVISVRH